MFEPIGGSAPKYTGQNVINPLAAICAGQMMLDFLGETEAADRVEARVSHVLGKKLKIDARREDGLLDVAGRRSGRRRRCDVLTRRTRGRRPPRRRRPRAPRRRAAAARPRARGVRSARAFD